MIQKVAVINVVALSSSLLKHAPKISAYAKTHGLIQTLPDLPAVTTTSQSTILTGTQPSKHGIVGNGWFNRQANEVQFWKQSNALVLGDKIWHDLKKENPNITTANLFWWYNMYLDADYSVTPRPIYKANGRKHPDCYSYPSTLRDQLQEKLGTFPLFSFWGPKANIQSTRWIADAAKYVFEKHTPDLNLVYLPHLDYSLQKLGPAHQDISSYVKEVDEIVGELIAFYESQNVKVIILSEYGISPVDQPIHINRLLRQQFGDDLAIRTEQGLELLDAGASQVFAVADHQVAHVYIKDPKNIEKYRAFIQTIDGIDQVLDQKDQQALGIHHPRSGELLLVSKSSAWFTYYYWLDDKKAPDFARTVDIHRKPGYDPCELFLDPKIKFPKFKIIKRLIQKKCLNQAVLLDVIPLDASLVKGSHGAVNVDQAYQPLLIYPDQKCQADHQPIKLCDIKAMILKLMLNQK